jgi:hypothetical protein
MKETRMKKTGMGLVLLVCAGVGAFAQSGVIADLSGTVELKPAGKTGFAPASIGDSVAQDTVISTGFKSNVTITVGSATIVARPLTRLTLAEITTMQGTETVNVNLQAGRVRVDVKPPAGTRANFTVQSPHATASVRGTEFEQDTRSIEVREGAVSYRGTNGPAVRVPAGAVTRVDSTVKNATRAQDPVAATMSALVPLPPAGADNTVPHDPTSASVVPQADPGISLGLEFR